jgi:hypothetical protein
VDIETTCRNKYEEGKTVNAVQEFKNKCETRGVHTVVRRILKERGGWVYNVMDYKVIETGRYWEEYGSKDLFCIHKKRRNGTIF